MKTRIIFYIITVIWASVTFGCSNGDETMNEIDIESERRIIENIKTEYDKTLILISHRKSNNDLFNKTVLV